MIEWFSIFVACTSYVSKMKCHIQLNNARKTNKILDVFLKTYAYFATIFGSLKSLKGLPT
jgi:hypothetical protein